MPRAKQKQSTRGARKPRPAKKPDVLPAEVPGGSALGNADLLARIGLQQLETETLRGMVEALREQNTDFRLRLVNAGLAVEPETEVSAELAEPPGDG